MGQVIDFAAARRADRSDQPAAPTCAGPAWPLSPVSYANHLLEPSWLIWRSLVASYAGFWLAPLGIEVKVGQRQAHRGQQARRSSGR